MNFNMVLEGCVVPANETVVMIVQIQTLFYAKFYHCVKVAIHLILQITLEVV